MPPTPGRSIPPLSPGQNGGRAQYHVTFKGEGGGAAGTGAGAGAGAPFPFAEVMKSPDPSSRRDTLIVARAVRPDDPAREAGAAAAAPRTAGRTVRDVTSSLLAMRISEGGDGGGGGTKDGEADPTLHRSATSIQAAARGMVTRRLILEAVDAGREVAVPVFTPSKARTAPLGGPNFTTPPPSRLPPPPGVERGQQAQQQQLQQLANMSPELEMLQEARRAIDSQQIQVQRGGKLGATAQLMADRRRTIGEAGIVPPVPPSPGDLSQFNIAMSCESPATSLVATPATDRRGGTPATPAAGGIAAAPATGGPGGFGWAGTPSPGLPRTALRSFTFDGVPAARAGPPRPQSSPAAGGGGTTPASARKAGAPATEAAGGAGSRELGDVAARLLTLTKAGRGRARADRKSSVMLKERLRRGSSCVVSATNGGKAAGGQMAVAAAAAAASGASSGGPPPPQAPLDTHHEHVRIAEELLSAHKSYIDGLMQTLRVEMDVLRDFEVLLRRRQQGGGGDRDGDGDRQNGGDLSDVAGGVDCADAAGRPTEDDVLDYFESVALCLDERTSIGDKLRTTMDRISCGEEPDEGDEDDLRVGGEEDI